MASNITFVQPCPPHEWAHANTVGYFLCMKCRERVNYDDPRYGGLIAECDETINRARTLSMPLDEGLVEAVVQKIYANVHHLMRVTGIEAQTAYEAAARSIIKEIAARAG